MAKVGTIILTVIALVVIFAGLSGCGAYNQLVALDENANKSWANVETVLQRRFDLIPNLVNTVKGYAKHESSVLEEVTRLRSQWGEAKAKGDLTGQTKAANGLDSALSRLMVVVERYPDLKANQNFIALQDELSGTENRISVERQRYNDAVQAYNTSLRRFPTVLWGRMFGFQRRMPFEAAAAAQTAPQVNF